MFKTIRSWFCIHRWVGFSHKGVSNFKSEMGKWCPKCNAEIALNEAEFLAEFGSF